MTPDFTEACALAVGMLDAVDLKQQKRCDHERLTEYVKPQTAKVCRDCGFHLNPDPSEQRTGDDTV